jgi:hypothetical protein
MEDFGRRHWLMLVSMSLLGIAMMVGAGFALEWFAGAVT